jgi:hypothetical protein
MLNANAYAPRGRPTRRVNVSVQIGSWSKSFAVLGDRVWKAKPVGFGPSLSTPFVTMPITYDRAFGGTVELNASPSKSSVFLANPSGQGFHPHSSWEQINGAPLPNTEELNSAIINERGNYSPMSFGPIGRNWAARAPFAGTYDETWLNKHFPFLPPDFDEQYYQAAPLDQQIPMPVGEQSVRLLNLTPDGDRSFILPHLVASVHVILKRGEHENLAAYTDTIIIEPTEERVTMVWRVARPLKKNIFEVAKVLVGRTGTQRENHPTDAVNIADRTEQRADRGYA